MSVVVVVTQPTRTVTAIPTSAGHPSFLSAGTVAGIIIGTLLGGVLFIALVLYLLNRYTRHKFTRVVNPAHDDVEGAHPSRRSKLSTRYSQKPSILSEPLMSPASWPPLPTTSRVLSPGSPPRLDPIFHDSQYSSFKLGEISRPIAPDSNIPPNQASPASSQPGLSNTPPHTWQTYGDGPSKPTKSSQTLFLHRMLKSRAQASEGVAPAHRPSLGFSSSRSTTLDSSDIHGDEERLLADAERSALQDTETAQRGEEEVMAEGEEGWEEVESAESIYSQSSAPIDHSGFFSEPVSRQNSSLTVPRRRSSRRQSRTPAPSTELPPVAEVPDTPRALEGQAVPRPVSTAANSSLNAQVSHETADQSGGTLPLLTSTNFGKDSTTATSGGSFSSTAGWGSSSSASRYPSLAPSSIGQSSQSGPRSDAGTDWHHPPSGLAGLTSLRMGPLLNPHSPVEQPPEQPDVSLAEPTPVKRARLREGTVSSLPEVERRDVMQGGIASIDVVL